MSNLNVEFSSAGNAEITVKEMLRGKEGFSPSVTVTDIDGGHRITVTNKDGTASFDVMDGEDGADWVPSSSELNSIAQSAAGIVQPSVTELSNGLSGKQDKINDLQTIREGAAAGATALQSVPIAAVGTFGLTKPYRDKTSYGITMDSNGAYINAATADDIMARTNKYKPITSNTLNTAVEAALTDSNAMSLTDDKKAKACETIGASLVGTWVERTITFSEDMNSYTIDLDGHKPIEIVTFCYMPTAAKGDSFFLKLGGNSGCIGRFNVGHATEKRKGVCRCTYSDGIWTSVNGFMATSLEGLSAQRSYGVFQNVSMNCAVCSNDFTGLLLASIDRTQIPTGTEIYIKYRY